jgi:ankyrin repeat protein
VLCIEFQFLRHKSLHSAIENKQAKVVDYLLSLGCETPVDSSSLTQSVINGNYKLVKICLKYGAVPYDHETIPFIAGAGHLTLVQKLLEDQPDLLSEDMLYQACLVGSLAFIERSLLACRLQK